MESSAPSLLMVEGSFYDQVDELAQYLDTVQQTPGILSAELAPLVEREEKDEIVRKLTGASSALSQAPEKGKLWIRDLFFGTSILPHHSCMVVRCGLKLILYGAYVEFIPSYNLLIHLVRPSPLLPELLPTILNNLSTPPSSSPNNGPALVLSILTTIFNVLPPTSNLRSTVFQNILKIISTHGLYEVLSPQLKNLDRWFVEWNSSDGEIRSILVTVANIAEEASDDECICLALWFTTQLITDIFQTIL